jgi:hypothetical protein
VVPTWSPATVMFEPIVRRADIYHRRHQPARHPILVGEPGALAERAQGVRAGARVRLRRE